MKMNYPPKMLRFTQLRMTSWSILAINLRKALRFTQSRMTNYLQLQQLQLNGRFTTIVMKMTITPLIHHAPMQCLNLATQRNT
jgi:hypothetical protein